MAEISRLSRLVAGISRGVDLSTNTLVVGDIKIGGSGGTLLTQTILDRLVAAQNGTDLDATYHTHDGRYFTETELGATSGTSGAQRIGIKDTAALFAGTEVETALAEVGQDAKDLRTLSGTSDGDTHLGTFTGSVIPNSATTKSALQALETYSENTRSLIQNFEWQESVKSISVSTPGSPVAGDRYLIGLLLGDSIASGAFGGHDGEIAEWDGSAWVFTTPTLGTFVSVDDEADHLYQFGGSEWTAKYFEATTASTGLTKIGFDVQLADANGNGIDISGGVLSVLVDDVTIERSGVSGNPLQVKDNGISAAKILLGNDAYLRGRNAADSADVNILKINASDRVEFASFPQVSGTPADANDLVNKAYVDQGGSKLSRSVVVGESFSANTTYVVRWALTGETAGRVYKADKDASVSDKFHAVGLLKVGTALSAGDTGTMTLIGASTQASGDSAFAGGDVGKPVFLGSAGAWTTTAPTSANDAVVIVAYVRTTSEFDVVPCKIMGVN